MPATSSQDVTTGDTLCDEKQPVILERMEFPDPVIKARFHWLKDAQDCIMLTNIRPGIIAHYIDSSHQYLDVGVLAWVYFFVHDRNMYAKCLRAAILVYLLG